MKIRDLQLGATIPKELVYVDKIHEDFGVWDIYKCEETGSMVLFTDASGFSNNPIPISCEEFIISLKDFIPEDFIFIDSNEIIPISRIEVFKENMIIKIKDEH